MPVLRFEVARREWLVVEAARSLRSHPEVMNMKKLFRKPANTTVKVEQPAVLPVTCCGITCCG
jgi:hypothetical protein